MVKADDGGDIKTNESSQANPRGEVRVIKQTAHDIDEYKAKVRYLIIFFIKS